jgi:hypothetical protein
MEVQTGGLAGRYAGGGGLDAVGGSRRRLDHRSASAYLVLAEGIHLFMQMKGWI